MDSLDVEYYEVNHGKKLVAFVDVFSMHYPAQFPETWRSCETTQYDMISSYALRASNTSTATWQAITIFADSRPALMKRAGLAGSFNAEGCHAIHSTGNQRAATLKLHLRVRLTA